MNIFQQAVKRICRCGTARTATHLVTEFGNELRQHGEFLGVWLVVYAIYECLWCAVRRFLAYLLGYSAVGKQHKLFNELVRFVALAEIYRQRLAVVVETEMYLCLLEVYCTCRETFLAHLLCKFVQCRYLLKVFAFAFFYYLLYLFVTETTVALYYCACYLEFLYFGLFVHGEYHRIGKLLLVGAQRTKEVAQVFGQHWDGAVNKVYRCGTLECFLVYDASLCHIVRNVGNVYANLP